MTKFHVLPSTHEIFVPEDDDTQLYGLRKEKKLVFFPFCIVIDLSEAFERLPRWTYHDMYRGCSASM